ncbi:RhuM family protein [Vreelandella titanicae]|uniref:RhuM family protein n=1 Tax=Halomonadaceae TaxID=28256 RepID=UPI0039BFA932
MRKFRFIFQASKRQVQGETQHYSLYSIVSVGSRLKSHRAVQFRKRATQVLHPKPAALNRAWYRVRAGGEFAQPNLN